MRPDDVLAFLRDELVHGPRLAEEIKAKAEDAGITPKQLRGARERLQVVTRKDKGFLTKWRWSLPGDPSVTAPTAPTAPAPRCTTVRPRTVDATAPRERSAVGRLWNSLGEKVSAATVVKAAAAKAVSPPEPVTPARTDYREQLLEDILRTFRGERQVVVEDVLARLAHLHGGLGPAINGRAMTPKGLEYLMWNCGVQPRWIPGYSTIVGLCREDLELALHDIRNNLPAPAPKRTGD